VPALMGLIMSVLSFEEFAGQRVVDQNTVVNAATTEGSSQSRVNRTSRYPRPLWTMNMPEINLHRLQLPYSPTHERSIARWDLDYLWTLTTIWLALHTFRCEPISDGISRPSQSHDHSKPTSQSPIRDSGGSDRGWGRRTWRKWPASRPSLAGCVA
jgi:hypothetical protein